MCSTTFQATLRDRCDSALSARMPHPVRCATAPCSDMSDGSLQERV
jgi:hypothetical protein